MKARWNYWRWKKENIFYKLGVLNLSWSCLDLESQARHFQKVSLDDREKSRHFQKACLDIREVSI